MKNLEHIKLITIGVSAGGIEAIQFLLKTITKKNMIPIVIVQHFETSFSRDFYKLLNRNSVLKIKEAEDQEVIEKGKVYIAPGGYHLLIDSNGVFCLDIFKKVNYCRPSIDIFFKSAAIEFKDEVLAIILTGANSDGAKGLKEIKKNGGYTIVQNPKSAFCSMMPDAAIKECKVNKIFELEEIIPFIEKRLFY